MHARAGLLADIKAAFLSELNTTRFCPSGFVPDRIKDTENVSQQQTSSRRRLTGKQRPKCCDSETHYDFCSDKEPLQHLRPSVMVFTVAVTCCDFTGGGSSGMSHIHQLNSKGKIKSGPSIQGVTSRPNSSTLTQNRVSRSSSAFSI